MAKQKIEDVETPVDEGLTAPATAQAAEVKAVAEKEEVARVEKFVTQVNSVREVDTLPTDTEYFKDGKLDKKKCAEMNALIKVRVIKDIKGCITIKSQYTLKAGEEVRVPKWFALTFKNQLVPSM